MTSEFRCACCNKLYSEHKNDNNEDNFMSIYIPWNRARAIMKVCDFCKVSHKKPKLGKSGNPIYTGGSNTPCHMPIWDGQKTINVRLRDGCKK